VQFRIAENGNVGFTLGAWDKTRPLIIDPALSFVSGAGGSASGIAGSGPDSAQSVALDSTGNIYVAGIAYSGDFPFVNPLPLQPGGTSCPSVFAAKLSPDGKTLLYSTLLVNSSYTAPTCGSASPPAIAVDAAGNACIAGAFLAGAAGGARSF
jgi:hypothetical protein